MKVTCNYCSHEVEEVIFVFNSNTKNSKTGQTIIISDAKHFECTFCSHQWLSEEQESSIRQKIKEQE